MIYKEGPFEVKAVKKGWVVVNTAGGYENHSHFLYSRKAAIRCAKYANRKIIRPSMKEYMLQAVKRVVTDEKFKEQLQRRIEKMHKEPKPRYVNFA